ncbi:MAG: helix-turn-helix transcriptional regulator [Actinobacteria bacterium]|nr:helix-turn-helix transcriptional regulator [Actinomycetota bacterium]
MDAARILFGARRRAGFTQRELSRRAGIPQSTISRIERGQISPKLETLARLVRACGMELEAVDAPGEHDLDRSLIRENLARSPAERGRRAVLDWRRVEAFRTRAKPA